MDVLLGAPDTPFAELPAHPIGRALTLDPSLSIEGRTKSVGRVLSGLRDSIVTGWRDELLPVTPTFPYDRPSFLVERAAAPHLGTVSFGVHVNGYCVDAESGEKKMWIARRSATKSLWPLMLDHIVAGGQPAGIGLMENVIKECGEEAGISEELASTAVPTSAVSYEYFMHSDYLGGDDFEDDDGTGTIKRDILFCFDIELPSGFVPVAADGEVEDFRLMKLEEVAACFCPDSLDPIKPNCNLVIADFMVRHGFIGPDDGPGYFAVVDGLRGSIN